MKYLFLCNCYEDELNFIPEDVEYLFINCFIIDNENVIYKKNNWSIKPNFNINMKFLYVQKIRYKCEFLKPNKEMFTLPFNCVYKFGKCIYQIYNFVISENKIKKYVCDDINKLLSSDLVYWFNITDKNMYNEYDYSITEKQKPSVFEKTYNELYNKNRIFIYPIFNKTLNELYKKNKLRDIYND